MSFKPAVALTAFLVVSAPAFAQTDAEAVVRRGCTNPAPQRSLLAAPLSPVMWRMEDNLAAIEIEAVSPVGRWRFENTNAGYSGSGYFRWTGPNYWTQPGNDILTYRVWVESAGTYQVRIHNRHDHPDPSEENDCWMSVNGSNWIKTYSNRPGLVRVWNWHFRFDPGHGVVQYNLNAGVNEIRISGRSTDFMIDRLHVYRAPVQGEDIRLPASDLVRSRPVIGQQFVLRAGDPTGQSGLQLSSTLARVLISTNSSGNCGVPIPVFGPNGGPGELLIDPNGGALPLTGAASVVSSSGQVNKQVDIPNDPGLLGLDLFAQGLLFDANGGIVLTDGLRLTFGDR